MSLYTRARAGGRHRTPSRTELRTNNQRLDRENNDLACALNAAKRAISQLQAERDAALKQFADLANATKVSDLPQRVTTVATDCRPLRERFTAGPVVFDLGHSPMATSPTSIPGWAQPAA